MKLSKTALRFLNQQYRAVLLACLVAAFTTTAPKAEMTGIDAITSLQTGTAVSKVETTPIANVAKTTASDSTNVDGTVLINNVVKTENLSVVTGKGTTESAAKLSDLKSVADVVNGSGTGTVTPVQVDTYGNITTQGNNLVASVNQIGKMLTEGEGEVNLKSVESDTLTVGTSSSGTAGKLRVTDSSSNTVFSVDGQTREIVVDGTVNYKSGLVVEAASTFGGAGATTIIDHGNVTASGKIEAPELNVTGKANINKLVMPTYAGGSTYATITSIDGANLGSLSDAFTADTSDTAHFKANPQNVLATAATVLNSAENGYYSGTKITGKGTGSATYTVKKALSDTAEQTNANTTELGRVATVIGNDGSGLIKAVNDNTTALADLIDDVDDHDTDIAEIKDKIKVSPSTSVHYGAGAGLGDAVSGLDTYLTKAETNISKLAEGLTDPVTGAVVKSVKDTVKDEAADATFEAETGTSIAPGSGGKLASTTLGAAINEVAQNYIQADANMLNGTTNFTGLKLVDDGSAGFTGLTMLDKTTGVAAGTTKTVKYIMTGTASKETTAVDANKLTLATADTVVNTVNDQARLATYVGKKADGTDATATSGDKIGDVLNDAIVKINGYTTDVGTKNTAAAGEPSNATGLFKDVEDNTTAIANLTDGTTKLTGLTMDTLTTGTTAKVQYITNDAVDATGSNNDKTLATAQSVLETVNASAGNAKYTGTVKVDGSAVTDTDTVSSVLNATTVQVVTNTDTLTNATTGLVPRVGSLETKVGDVDLGSATDADLRGMTVLTDAVLNLDSRINGLVSVIDPSSGTVSLDGVVKKADLAKDTDISKAGSNEVAASTAYTKAYVDGMLEYTPPTPPPSPSAVGTTTPDYSNYHTLSGSSVAVTGNVPEIVAETLNYLNQDTDAINVLNGEVGTAGSVKNTVKTEAGNATYVGVKVDGSSSTSTDTINSVLSATNTNVKALNDTVAGYSASIGKIGTADFSHTHYLTTGAADVTQAVKTLDSELNRVEGRMDHYEEKMKDMDDKMKSGFASLAAMSALQPNARACSDTQISMGTGTYKGQVGLAVGAFHYFNDNLMMNVGGSFAGNDSATFRGGITFGW